MATETHDARLTARHRPRRQLSDEVTGHIRELIVSGQLRPGTFIRQDRIAEELQLSGTPVREGLMALRGEGFVVLKPRRGFVVAPLSGRDIHDLFVAQALLAGELAARATDELDPAAIASLEEIDGDVNRAAANGDVAEVERLNHEFHRFINLRADSARLSWMLSVSVRFAPRRFYATIPGWAEASARDHEAVLSAFRAGDAEAARTAMRTHVEHAGVLLAQHFDRPDNPAGTAPTSG